MTGFLLLLFELIGMYFLCMVVMRGAVRSAHKTTDAISKRAQQRRSLANATVSALRKKARMSLELRRNERRRRTDLEKVGREIESLRRQLHEAMNSDRKIIIMDDRNMASPRWLVTVVRWQQPHSDPDWQPGLCAIASTPATRRRPPTG